MPRTTSFCRPCSSDLPLAEFVNGKKIQKCCHSCRGKSREKAKQRRIDTHNAWVKYRKSELDDLKINTKQCFWCQKIECTADIALYSEDYITCQGHEKMDRGLHRLLMSLAKGAYSKYRPSKKEAPLP